MNVTNLRVHIFFQPDEDLFNPDYVEVDRILEVAVTTDTETGEVMSTLSRQCLKTVLLKVVIVAYTHRFLL